MLLVFLATVFTLVDPLVEVEDAAISTKGSDTMVVEFIDLPAVVVFFAGAGVTGLTTDLEEAVGTSAGVSVDFAPELDLITYITK